jgi:hypothetical protein
MKIGDLFIWVYVANNGFWEVNDIGRVIELRDEGKSLLVNNFIPDDAGELRQVPVGSSYVKRAETVLRSKKPGDRIQGSRRRCIKLALQGITKR